MIISMKLHATRQEIDEVRKQVEHFGYKVHSIEGEERVVIGVVGVGDVTACMESVESMPQVEKVVRISAPYKFVSREFRPARRFGSDCSRSCGARPCGRFAALEFAPRRRRSGEPCYRGQGFCAV